MPLTTRNVLRQIVIITEPVILIKLVRSYKNEEFFFCYRKFVICQQHFLFQSAPLLTILFLWKTDNCTYIRTKDFMDGKKMTTNINSNCSTSVETCIITSFVCMTKLMCFENF